MRETLKNKRIVIIGGTSGIGLSAAKAFIRAGAQVLAVGLDKESCQKAKEILAAAALVIQGDARVEGIADQAIEACENNFGGLDGLYHVAGGSGRKWGDGPLHDLSLEAWNKTIALNLTSVMLSNRAAARFFLKQEQGGSILNLSSVLAYAPSSKFFYTHAYAAAKSAVIGFSRSLAAYYAPHNIRVNVLAPALTLTPMAERAANDQSILDFTSTKQPLDGGRLGRPADLDGAACYFLSDLAGFTTGQVLAVDGGWSVSDGQY